MAKKIIINGCVMPSIKSVMDALKDCSKFYRTLDTAIEITDDGEVYGGIKPSLANTCSPRSLAVGNNGGRVYTSAYYFNHALHGSDYALRKAAKTLIEVHKDEVQRD